MTEISGKNPTGRAFYDPRLATLTPAEQDLLLASAKCP
jgi:hypothetical protein